VKNFIVVDQACNREQNWTISDSKDAITEWWTEDDLHRHKNYSYGTVGWAIRRVCGSASRSTNQGRNGTSSLWYWSERETNQAWLLVLVGWVTPTASFTTHWNDAKTASSERWKRTESTRHDRCSTMTTILILDWVIVSEQWMLFSIHRLLSLPDLSHRRLRQLTQERPRAKSGALGVHPSKRPINAYPWWSRPGIPVFTECLMDWHQNRTARKPHPIMRLRPTLKSLFKTQRIFQSLNLSRSNHISD
jgi:hypothetical protein